MNPHMQLLRAGEPRAWLFCVSTILYLMYYHYHHTYIHVHVGTHV